MTRPGVYQHYKNGALYRVLFEAMESTNGRPRAPVVVYVALKPYGTLEVRDAAEFNGTVEIEEGTRDSSIRRVPRFEYIGS